MKSGISVKQTARMFAERVMDLLPGADRVHDAIGRTGGASFLDFVRGPMVRWKLERWRFLLRVRPRLLEGARVLDLGTGWTGHDLMLMHLFGASRIDTFDRVAHLRPECIGAAREGLGLELDAIESLGATGAAMRLKAVPTASVDAFLEHIGATSHTSVPLHAAPLAPGYDLFFSYSTLQCLPVHDLGATMRAARSLMRAGATAFHDVRFTDNYYATGGSPLGFLRWPDPLWTALQSRFNNHNRLRHSEFVRLVESAGFSLIEEQSTLLPENVVRATPMLPRFSAHDIEDLRVGNATMVFRVNA